MKLTIERLKELKETRKRLIELKAEVWGNIDDFDILDHDNIHQATKDMITDNEDLFNDFDYSNTYFDNIEDLDNLLYYIKDSIDNINLNYGI